MKNEKKKFHEEKYNRLNEEKKGVRRMSLG